MMGSAILKNGTKKRAPVDFVKGAKINRGYGGRLSGVSGSAPGGSGGSWSGSGGLSSTQWGNIQKIICSSRYASHTHFICWHLWYMNIASPRFGFIYEKQKSRLIAFSAFKWLFV